MSKKKLVIVLGMHRSGTSAITRGLDVIGIDLGNNLHPAGFDNPKGFWEDKDVIKINEELLGLMGSAYDRLGLLKLEMAGNPDIAELELRAVSTLREKTKNSSICGIKDPRIARLLPFWKKVFEYDGFEVGYVIALRNPISVADSLAKRNGFDRAKSYLLWLEHVIPAVALTKAEKRLVVDYDRLLSSPQNELLRVSAALSLGEPAPDALMTYQKEFLEEGLRHTQYETSDLALDPEVPSLLIETYKVLSHCAEDGLSLDSVELVQDFEGFLHQLNGLGPALRYCARSEQQINLINQAVAERDIQIADYSQAMGERDAQIANLHHVVSERDGEIAGVCQTLAERDAQNAFYRQAIAESDSQIASLNLSLVERDERIANLELNLLGRDERIASLELNLLGRDERIASLELNLLGRDERIANLELSLLGRDEQIADLNRQLSTLLHALRVFFSSKYWRWTKPLRAMSNFFLRKKGNGKGSLQEEIQFNPTFYLATYPDIAASGLDPLEHYLTHGLKEGRAAVPCDSRLAFLNDVDNETDGQLSEIEADVADGASLEFDESFYLAQYPDVAVSGLDPLEHYLNYGLKEGRAAVPNDSRLTLLNDADKESGCRLDEIEADIATEVSIEFGESFYLAQYPDIAVSGLDPLEHDLNDGLKEGRAAVPCDSRLTLLNDADKESDFRLDEIEADITTEVSIEFDEGFYLAQYPDIAASGILPYEHFMLHGRHEGRLGCPPALEHIGDFTEFDSARDTVLVVSHEASRTGAPVLSLNLVQILGQKYNVVALLLGGGMLENAFRESGAVVVGPLQLRGNPLVAKLMVEQLLERCRFKFALINSIESRVVLPALASHFVPTISLIHEFAAYTRPKEAFREALFWSGETIFSAQLTLKSAHAEYPELGERTAHILPQGRCKVPTEELNPVALAAEELRVRRALRPEAAAKDTVVILGAGFVQLRKGVDLFIECAARVVHSPQGAHCRFVWVGNGYDPEHDVGYSVYLADQIRRARLERHVFFVEETPVIDVAYQQADLLLLSSRLDPLPNVAIDAMAHGVPVVCFAETTGIADFLIESGLGQECVAPYLDTADMADKILALAGSRVLRENVSARSQQASLERFDMARYVTNLEEIAATVEERTRQEQADVEEIEKSDLLRLDFFSLPHQQGQSRKAAIRSYVRAWASGIGRRKLFPGFHPGIYLEQHGVEKEGVDPLADYLRAGQPDGPWRQPVITCEETALPIPADTRVALHLHVYYPDLLPDMLIRLAQNKVRPDLFVSIPAEVVRDQVTRLLQEYAGKVVDIQVVPNRGRDIGPFLTAFGAQFVAGYDIVGHLHTKKTADIKDESLGKTWYRFLLENLLGGQANMADIILGQMASDPSIGMVFPDDPYITSWSSNKVFAEQLSGQLNIAAAKLPEYFVFPVGTMFWARVDAIKPVFNRNLEWTDYPEEPLPYDGSPLHALERLLPFVCRNSGRDYALTNAQQITR